jgi:hypothetical protein
MIATSSSKFPHAAAAVVIFWLGGAAAAAAQAMPETEHGRDALSPTA